MGLKNSTNPYVDTHCLSQFLLKYHLRCFLLEFTVFFKFLVFIGGRELSNQHMEALHLGTISPFSFSLAFRFTSLGLDHISMPPWDRHVNVRGCESYTTRIGDMLPSYKRKFLFFF